MPKNIRIALALIAAATSAAARADLVDIAWSAQGRFEHRMTVAPGKFAEVCGKLAKADSVAWRFEASGPLDFNVHYHEGKEVHYPERRKALAGASGQLRVALDQDYCWMWTNKSGQSVDLRLQLAR